MMEDYPLQTAFGTPVNICFVSDEGYAEPLRTALYSLLCNRDKMRLYDILILYENFSDEAKQRTLRLAEGEQGVRIRFIDIAPVRGHFPKTANAYYTAAINYRLYLFDKMFTNYGKMLYLDCDMIFLEDVGRLFDTELGEKEVAAVRSEDFRVLSKTRRAVYLDDYPYNVDNYRTDGLGMQHPEDYFNSGVLLLDLEKARQRITMPQIYEMLARHKYTFSDQDVLNMLFDGRVFSLDIRWNFMTCVAEQLQSGNRYSEELYADLRREDPAVIHYVGHKKPWNADKILSEHYQYYRSKLEELQNQW